MSGRKRVLSDRILNFKIWKKPKGQIPSTEDIRDTQKKKEQWNAGKKKKEKLISKAILFYAIYEEIPSCQAEY